MENRDDGEDPAKDSGRSDADRIILVVCPTHRDHRELPLLSPPGISYLFHDYASTSLEDLICNAGIGQETGLLADIGRRLVRQQERGQLDGVLLTRNNELFRCAAG